MLVFSRRLALARRAAVDAERQEQARRADQALIAARTRRDATGSQQQDQEHHD